MSLDSFPLGLSCVFFLPSSLEHWKQPPRQGQMLSYIRNVFRVTVGTTKQSTPDSLAAAVHTALMGGDAHTRPCAYLNVHARDTRAHTGVFWSCGFLNGCPTCVAATSGFHLISSHLGILRLSLLIGQSQQIALS